MVVYNIVLACQWLVWQWLAVVGLAVLYATCMSWEHLAKRECKTGCRVVSTLTDMQAMQAASHKCCTQTRACDRCLRRFVYQDYTLCWVPWPADFVRNSTHTQCILIIAGTQSLQIFMPAMQVLKGHCTDAHAGCISALLIVVRFAQIDGTTDNWQVLKTLNSTKQSFRYVTYERPMKDKLCNSNINSALWQAPKQIW